MQVRSDGVILAFRLHSIVRLASRNSLARLLKDYNSIVLWHGEAVEVSNEQRDEWIGTMRG